jgi:hypothetical protein
MRQRKGERLPSYDELLDAAERAAVHVPVGEAAAIAGGLAMQIWGSSRLTGDLDLVADSSLGYEGEPLTFGGVRTREEGVKLDVIVRDDEWEELYADALTQAVDVEEVPLPVITPEYLAAMKMVAGRPKDDADLRYLVTSDDFDFEEAEEILKAHLGKYAVQELRAVKTEAEWRKSRGEE